MAVSTLKRQALLLIAAMVIVAAAAQVVGSAAPFAGSHVSNFLVPAAQAKAKKSAPTSKKDKIKAKKPKKSTPASWNLTEATKS